MFKNPLNHPDDSHYTLSVNPFLPMHTHRLPKTTIATSPKRIGAPHEAIGQRKIAGEEITRAIGEARLLLKNRRAPLMRQFNITGTTPETIAKHLFHEAYQTARIIVDAPSKKRKPDEGGTDGGVNI